MAEKPAIPKGTRDFLPEEMARREYIFTSIKQVFSLYGYVPIETPAMENLTTLMGKYGEEGDRLLFKILNSGDFMKKVPESVDLSNARVLSSFVAEKGLRYDLTVPFARYVVQHRNDLVSPFKRYQIQPVWRADRPQKGRYREFYQCDADVVGSDSLLNEIELIQLIADVFKRLNLKVQIHINNRKILQGIASYIGTPDQLIDITVAIDKMDKIGEEKVIEELLSKGIAMSSVDKLLPILRIDGGHEQKISLLRDSLAGIQIAEEGIDEISFILAHAKQQQLPCEVEIDLTLARGLNYYTGTIFEVKSLDTEMGSICGGGRYDNLTAVFGLQNVSGVGISFGAERIYDVMDICGLFPEEATRGTQVLFVNFSHDDIDTYLAAVNHLRKAGIRSELYPDQVKIKKQMQYADRKKIPYVILMGEEEIAGNQLTFKCMKTGEQKRLSIEELVAFLNAHK